MNKLIFKARPKIGMFFYLFIFMYLVLLFLTILTYVEFRANIINFGLFLFILIINITGLLWLLCLFPVSYKIYQEYIQIDTLLKKWRIFFDNIEEIVPIKVSEYIFVPSGKLLFSFKNNIVIKRKKGFLGTWVIIAPSDKYYKNFLEIAQAQLKKIKYEL